MSAYEVTQGQWLAVMGSNPSWFSENGHGDPCGSGCPVEQVSWDDVQNFIDEVNHQFVIRLLYPWVPVGHALGTRMGNVGKPS